ncbi:hypothetical protein [Dyadobacter sp. CY326]|uniref:hypothetical protein n=1 Tax=Dyadobacter sp. CY326 TaxID=2907300 RepID=UPI001F457C2F|nr:hypothetical protein [Dyadobacter sp. CY326]MCE7064969.1 hypothetical protein [Dyadobacter sp. CY326]
MTAIKFSAQKKFHLLQCKTRSLNERPEHLSHYRVLFVISGEGKFVLNHEIHSYCPQGVIFLEPEQKPLFQEDKVTEAFMIAFDTHLADDFQKKKALTPDFADTYKLAENICKNLRIRQGQPIRDERDAQMVHYLVNQISYELTQQPASYLKLIKSSIDLIVNILARNNYASKMADENSIQQFTADSMVTYLKTELERNKTIRVNELLSRFNISEEAANLCMLHSTGMSLRNFILKYKTDLFKSRLLKMDISQPSA